MLMSDSLGGSAKTLMFVNVSPTDSNLDETQTSLAVRHAAWPRHGLDLVPDTHFREHWRSCAVQHLPLTNRRCFVLTDGFCCVAQYATRVRTIKNVVTQSTSTKEVIKLQKQLEYWKEQAGLSPEQRAVVDLNPIEDARFVVEQEDV